MVFQDMVVFHRNFSLKEEVDRYWILTAGFSKDLDQLLTGRLVFPDWILDRIGFGLVLVFLLDTGLFATDQLLTQSYIAHAACTIAYLLIFEAMVITAGIVKQRICYWDNNGRREGNITICTGLKASCTS
jgi:hypothetical protein